MLRTTFFLAAVVAAAHAYTPSYFFFGWYGFEPAEQAGWVSLGVSRWPDKLVEGKRLGIPQQFYSLEDEYLTHGMRDGAEAIKLVPDWERRWNASLPLYQSLLDNRTICGFFLGDELMWNGFPYDELVMWSNAIRAAFPDAWLWENEAVPSYGCDPAQAANRTRNCTYKYEGCCDFHGRPIYATSVPPALSSTSIDKYQWNPAGPAVVPLVQTYYNTYLKPRLHEGQSLFLVPGSTIMPHDKHCNASCFEQLVSDDAKAFYAWAQADPVITGMVPWTWFPDADKYIGTRNMTSAKATWQAIGRAVLGTL